MNSRTPVRTALLALTLSACTAQTHPETRHPMTTQYLTTAQGRLAYDDTRGHGPLIVAIPGMGDTRGQYRDLSPALQQAGYRVVTLDIRGQGESSAAWNDYSAHAIAQDALALIDHLGVRNAVIIGNSFAAGAALWAAHDRPEKVNGVILIGPVTRDLPSPWYLRPVMKAALGGPWNRSFWMTYRKSLFPARKSADFHRHEAQVRENLGEAGRMQALKEMIFMPKAPTEAILGQIQTPTLVVMGTKDPDFPDATAEGQFVAGRTHGELLLVTGAGHYPHVEFPELVGPRVLAFLKGLR